MPTGLDSACWGLGLLLMSAAPGSTHFQAGLLQPDFSRLGVRISWAFSCCGPRNSPCCIQPPASSLPPPVSSRALNRPVPHCLFATSWHPAAPGTVPFCPAIQRGTCSQWGAVGTTWVPCALCHAHGRCSCCEVQTQWQFRRVQYCHCLFPSG